MKTEAEIRWKKPRVKGHLESPEAGGDKGGSSSRACREREHGTGDTYISTQ